MPRIFDHADLRVHDLAAAGPFYRQFLPLLGFTVRVDIPDWIQFESPGPGVGEFLGVREDKAHRSNRSRLAFWAESTARVDELAARLPLLGACNIEGPDFESPTYYAVYFDDPSGNPLEICHRTQRFTV
jgi:catechol 2,3-dioxygenase-like lactoylglutathione lyase family enzyme